MAYLRITLNETYDKYTVESNRFRFYKHKVFSFYLGVLVVDPKDLYGQSCDQVIKIEGGVVGINVMVGKSSATEY